MMDSFEINKIAGAVLSVLLFVMGLGIFSNAIFHAQVPTTPGYDLPSAEVAAAAAPAAPVVVPVAQILASADPARGAGLTKAACGACHNVEQGSGSKAGPTLYDIVNRPIASTASYAYSSSLVEKAKTDKVWSFEALNAFILNPKGYASNTKMAYGGLKDDGRRGDVLAYLRSLASSPAPLPTQ